MEDGRRRFSLLFFKVRRHGDKKPGTRDQHQRVWPSHVWHRIFGLVAKAREPKWLRTNTAFSGCEQPAHDATIPLFKGLLALGAQQTSRKPNGSSLLDLYNYLHTSAQLQTESLSNILAKNNQPNLDKKMENPPPVF